MSNETIKNHQGGGAASLQLAALPRGTCLPPIRLEQQGMVTSITLFAYCAGKIPPHVPRRMATAAEDEFRKAYTVHMLHLVVRLSLCACANK